MPEVYRVKGVTHTYIVYEDRIDLYFRLSDGSLSFVRELDEYEERSCRAFYNTGFQQGELFSQEMNRGSC